jgi:uncharacterized membrane protein
MESKVKLFGHPIHPMLIVLPLGLFIMAVVCDIGYMSTQSRALTLVSYWNIAGGLLGGLLAAVFGLIDFLAIPSGTRAKTIGLYHGLVNLIVVALFGVSWLMRASVDDHVPSLMASVLIVVGLMLGAVGGWLGGELVDRLGVGVDEGANLNAPSSLRGRAVTPGRSR